MNEVAFTCIGLALVFVMNALGAAAVFLFRKEISPRFNTLFLGFASGVMVAASVWSLLLPSLEGAADWGTWSFVPAVGGFLLGGVFLVILDKLVPHTHCGTNEDEGLCVALKKPVKLLLAVTLHNIPEGLAVGFAFGAAAMAGSEQALVAALALAVGIGIQNLPEGAAVALPMKSATGSRGKAFGYAVLSGAAEPLFGIVGFFLAAHLAAAQPWFLAFAAGAMIFVVAEDLIPDAKMESHPHLGTWGVMLGFVLMMTLDVVFG